MGCVQEGEQLKQRPILERSFRCVGCLPGCKALCNACILSKQGVTRAWIHCGSGDSQCVLGEQGVARTFEFVVVLEQPMLVRWSPSVIECRASGFKRGFHQPCSDGMMCVQ